MRWEVDEEGRGGMSEGRWREMEIWNGRWSGEEKGRWRERKEENELESVKRGGGFRNVKRIGKWFLAISKNQKVT